MEREFETQIPPREYSSQMSGAGEWFQKSRNVMTKKLSRYPRIKMFLGLGFFEPFQYTINSLNSQEEFYSGLYDKSFRRINQDDTVTGENRTLYILGSGPSVASLTEKHFNTISESDSMGFNFWMHHWFVPDYYVLQIPREPSQDERLSDLIKQKSQNYASCKVFLRGDHAHESSYSLKLALDGRFGGEPLIHLPEFPMTSDSSIPVESQLRFLDNLKFAEKGSTSSFVPKPAGTLGLCIFLGLQMGYDNIILLGVDMNDTNHFFQEPKPESLGKRLRKKFLPSKGTFMDKSFGTSHKDWIIGIARFLESEKGAKVWLGTEGSALSGHLDQWKW